MKYFDFIVKYFDFIAKENPFIQPGIISLLAFPSSIKAFQLKLKTNPSIGTTDIPFSISDY
jgi:hypothetical protein